MEALPETIVEAHLTGAVICTAQSSNRGLVEGGRHVQDEFVGEVVP
jgi:hypothetical protein